MVEDISGAFSPLGQLWKLDLAHNRIKSINQNAFTGLSRVVELDLIGNNVTSIQENAFLSMSSLSKLKMNTGEFECSLTLYTKYISGEHNFILFFSTFCIKNLFFIYTQVPWFATVDFNG